MFIICPKCGAKYKIPSETTLESGQKLKCSACDFIFEKGQEAPLPLTETTPEEPTSPINQPKPFEKPMYHESDLNISPRDSFATLPEAFQPISTPTTAHKSFWVILPLYLIIIAVLCVAGWSFREMLKPTFSGYLPLPTIQQPDKKVETPLSPKAIPSAPLPKATLPTQITPEKPATKPTPVKEKTAPAPVAQPIDEKTVVKAEPIISPKPVMEAKPIIKPEVKAPQKVEESILPETDTFTIPDDPAKSPNTDVSLNAIIPPVDDIPLFEVVQEKPAIKTDLIVQNLTHQTSQNSDGVNQLLIDGVLKNTGNTPLPIPTITAFVFDKDGHVLAQKPIYVSESEINATQEIPFYVGIVPAPESTDHIDIKF